MHLKLISKLSLINVLLIIIVSVAGLQLPDFYTGETHNWLVQSQAQDMVNLMMIAPCLLIVSLLAGRNEIALAIWAGIQLYLMYTFAIYCFDVHFNMLFIIYCFILGSSLYSFLYYLYAHMHYPAAKRVYNTFVLKLIALYFIIIGCFFAVAWLAEIILAVLHNTKPTSLVETGLTTNPVEVIDLAIILPAFFITAILIFYKKSLVMIITKPLLIFSAAMSITIALLQEMMHYKNIITGNSITVIMGALALLSIFLFAWLLKSSSAR